MSFPLHPPPLDGLFFEQVGDSGGLMICHFFLFETKLKCQHKMSSGLARQSVTQFLLLLLFYLIIGVSKEIRTGETEMEQDGKIGGPDEM